MYIFLSVFLTVSYAGFIHTQTWYYPDPTTVPSFNNIDVINASWSIPATSSSTSLWLWCTPNGTMSYTLEFNVSVPFDGNRLVNLNYGYDLYCHFGIADGNLPTGNFRIQASDQPAVVWASLPDPSPTTSTAGALIASSLVAPAVSSAFTTSTGSSSTSSLTTAATMAKTLIPSTSSLSMATSLVTSQPSLYRAPKSMNATTGSSSSLPSTLLSTLPSTSPQSATEVTSSKTLSTGAKVGIIVAAIAVIAISALNIFYFIRMRMKSSNLRSEPPQVTEDKKVETQWSSELQGPEFAVEKDCPANTPKKELWELQ